MSGCLIRPEKISESIASEVGSRISACGSNGFASRQCFNVGRLYFSGKSDVRLTGCVDTVRVPPERLHFVDSALSRVAQRTGPVNAILRSKLVAD